MRVPLAAVADDGDRFVLQNIDVTIGLIVDFCLCHFRTSSEKEIFFIGIIIVLQTFTVKRMSVIFPLFYLFMQEDTARKSLLFTKKKAIIGKTTDIGEITYVTHTD